jgi:hypothetical protein
MVLRLFFKALVSFFCALNSAPQKSMQPMKKKINFFAPVILVHRYVHGI